MEVDAVSTITAAGFQKRTGSGQLQLGQFIHAGAGDHDLTSCDHGDLFRAGDELLSINKVYRKIALHLNATQSEFVRKARLLSTAQQAWAENALHLNGRINDFCVEFTATNGIASRFGAPGRDGAGTTDDGVPKL